MRYRVRSALVAIMAGMLLGSGAALADLPVWHPDILATAVSVSANGSAAMTSPADAVTQAQVSSSYGKLPLSFEINRGQTDSQVKFLARAKAMDFF